PLADDLLLPAPHAFGRQQVGIRLPDHQRRRLQPAHHGRGPRRHPFHRQRGVAGHMDRQNGGPEGFLRRRLGNDGDRERSFLLRQVLGLFVLREVLGLFVFRQVFGLFVLGQFRGLFRRFLGRLRVRELLLRRLGPRRGGRKVAQTLTVVAG